MTVLIQAAALKTLPRPVSGYVRRPFRTSRSTSAVSLPVS